MPTLTNNRQIVLLETLGSGGFGAVYLAEIRGPDGFAQRVALKVLHQTHAQVADMAARQRDEARLLARLNHDHIVKVLDLTTLDGRPAVVMEYVDGVDAGHLRDQGPLPPRAALEIAAGAASALQAAVETLHPETGRPLRVVHRDIKPANLLVTAAGGLKVLDFGVARAELEREGQTEGVAFGTIRYMAPETLLHGQVSPAVDVYALGVSVAELLLGAAIERAPLGEERHAAWRRALGADVKAVLPSVAVDWTEATLTLLDETLAWAPEARLSAADLHHRAWDLAEAGSGEGLRRYAWRVVPPLLAARRAVAPAPPPLASDRLEVNAPEEPELAQASPVLDPSPGVAPVDAVAPESASPSPPASVHEPLPPAPERAAPRLSERQGSAIILAAIGMAFLALIAVSAAGYSVWARRGEAPEQTSAPVVPNEAVPATVSAPPTAEEPEGSAEAESPPTPEPATPAPPASPATRSSAARAQPKAAAVQCAEAPAEGLVEVRLSSEPLGAAVSLNGARVGATPLLSCWLPEGPYTVMMSTPDGRRGQRALTVRRRSPPGLLWHASEDRWEALY